MPNKHNKKRQSKHVNTLQDDPSQPPNDKAHRDAPHTAAALPLEVRPTASVEGYPVRKIDKGKAPAHRLPTPNIATGTDITTAGFVSSSTLAADANPDNTNTSPSASASPAMAQKPHHITQDYITSLRLATSQTNAETARLQDVLDGKKAELQVLKERLRVLTGGSKNKYARRMKVVRRGVEGRRGEREEM